MSTKDALEDENKPSNHRHVMIPRRLNLSWSLSALVHGVLLLCLGMMTLTLAQEEEKVELVASVDPTESIVEESLEHPVAIDTDPLVESRMDTFAPPDMTNDFVAESQLDVSALGISDLIEQDTELISLPSAGITTAMLTTELPLATTMDSNGAATLGPTKIPPVTTDNKNVLGKKYRETASVTASTVWRGWPAEKVLDGVIESSWFSAKRDAAAFGTRPWVQIAFPEDVVLNRFTVLGNREAKWLIGYTILSGRVDVFDRRGRLIKSVENRGVGNFRDFDFKFARPLHKVRAVRFTSTADQGNHNPHQDIAIAELQVE